MYKQIQSKKYRLVIEFFNIERKRVKAYRTGIRIWETMDGKNYAVVLSRFRMMFGIKKEVNVSI